MKFTQDTFFHLFFLLACAHFLCDFALQSDWMAKAKNPFVNGKYIDNEIWRVVLLAHCMIHAGAVLFITGSVTAAIIVLVTHLVIDYCKCAGKMSFTMDQLLHLLIMVVAAIVTIHY